MCKHIIPWLLPFVFTGLKFWTISDIYCTTSSMILSLSKLQELVMGREAWRAVIHGITKNRTQLSDWTELNWIPISHIFWILCSLQTYGCQGARGWRDSWGVWDAHVHTAAFKMDNQYGSTALHGELCSLLHGGLDGRRFGGRIDKCILMTELLAVHLNLSNSLLAILQYKIKG